MENITALRALRALAGRNLVTEARHVSIPPTALAMAEVGLAVSDRSKRLLLRRHPHFTWARLQSRVGPESLHVPKAPVTI